MNKCICCEAIHPLLEKYFLKNWYNKNQSVVIHNFQCREATHTSTNHIYFPVFSIRNQYPPPREIFLSSTINYLSQHYFNQSKKIEKTCLTIQTIFKGNYFPYTTGKHQHILLRSNTHPNGKKFPYTAGKRNVSYYKVTLNFHEKHFQYTAGKRDISYYKVIHNFNEKHLTYTAEKRNVSVK